MFTFDITQKAANKIKQIKKEFFKISVVFGGCSGLNYKFEIVEKENYKKEEMFSLLDVNVIIDENSQKYLNNCKLDYTSKLIGESFVIINSNAKNTCGCGDSFNLF